MAVFFIVTPYQRISISRSKRVGVFNNGESIREVFKCVKEKIEVRFGKKRTLSMLS